MDRITAKDYVINEAALKKGKRNKYGARKVKIDGYTFDSDKEGTRYRELKLMVRAGEISDLQVHPRFPFSHPQVIVEYENGRVACYVGDFKYIENGMPVVEDVKSKITKDVALYRLKKAMMKAFHGIEIKEVVM